MTPPTVVSVCCLPLPTRVLLQAATADAFLRCKVAYEVLSDDEQRRQYDESLAAAAAAAGAYTTTQQVNTNSCTTDTVYQQRTLT